MDHQPGQKVRAAPSYRTVQEGRYIFQDLSPVSRTGNKLLGGEKWPSPGGGFGHGHKLSELGRSYLEKSGEMHDQEDKGCRSFGAVP
jgi:hypothetical protein